MRRKILYVEDDPINAFILDKLLNDSFDVVHVPDGESCISKLESDLVDLVLMDINLGGGKMDGVTTLRAIRENEKLKNLPVVAITSYAMPEDERRFLGDGFSGYMSKPLYRERLIELISTFLS